jgi:hypothetical protein
LKKIILLLVLFPFLYFNIGYYPFFLLKQQIIKNEIKQKLSSNIPINEITELILDKTTFNSLKWVDENEISYNDHLFDVIKIEIAKNNTIHISCIDDKKESSLIAELYKQIQLNEKTTKDQDITLTELFVTEYLPTKVLTFKIYYNIINYYTGKKDTYKSFIPDMPSPPPKFS